MKKKGRKEVEPGIKRGENAIKDRNKRRGEFMESPAFNNHDDGLLTRTPGRKKRKRNMTSPRKREKVFLYDGRYQWGGGALVKAVNREEGLYR